MRITTRLAIPALLLTSLCLSGCSFQAPQPTLETSPTALQGTVFGGQSPVSGITVTVYAVGSSGYGTGATSMASTTTNSSGAFSFASNAYTCPASNTPMYIVATGSSTSSPANSNLALIAALGNCSTAKSATVILNEVTTAATVVALGQFMDPTLGSAAEPIQIGGTCYSSGTTVCAAGTYNAGLVHAMNYTYPQLVTNSTGTAVASSTSGGITITTESAKLNSIANSLAYCVNSTGETSATETSTNCGKLFNGVNATSASPRPYDTIQAALMMDLYPYYNVSTVFGYGQGTGAPFVGLGSAPNDWTVGISYASPNFGLSVNPNTSSSIDIDTTGRVWFPTNTATSHGLAYFDPASLTFNGPYATTLSHPQYVAIDSASSPVAWGTDTSAALVEGAQLSSPATTTSITVSSYTSTQAIAVDYANNLYFGASNGSSGGFALYEASTARSSAALVAGLGGLPTGIALSDTSSDPIPFITDNFPSSSECILQYVQTANLYTVNANLSCATSGGAVYTYGGSGYWDSIGSFASVNRLSSYLIGYFTPTGANGPQGLAVDGANHLWVANSGDGSLFPMAVVATSSSSFLYNTIPPTAYAHKASNGGTTSVPYGIAIDASGNVWLSNAGCTTASCTPGSFVLSEIVGAAAPTVTPLAIQNANKTVGTKPTQ